MKNAINTGQFRMKMGSRENGRKTPLPASHKYGNGWNKIENRTGRNEIFSRPFSSPLARVSNMIPPKIDWI